MKIVLAVIAGVVSVLVVGVLFTSDEKEEIKTENTTQVQYQQAPDFSLKDFNGNTVSMGDFNGRPLVINSWAAWCVFCIKELEDFKTAQKEFGENIAIIAINRSESITTAKKLTDEVGITNDLIFLLDPSDSYYRSINGYSMPETIFVDKAGRIIEHKRGPMNVEEIRNKIEKLL